MIRRIEFTHSLDVFAREEINSKHEYMEYNQ